METVSIYIYFFFLYMIYPHNLHLNSRPHMCSWSPYAQSWYMSEVLIYYAPGPHMLSSWSPYMLTVPLNYAPYFMLDVCIYGSFWILLYAYFSNQKEGWLNMLLFLLLISSLLDIFVHHPISRSDLRQELDVTKKKKDEPETPPTPTVVKVKPEVKVEPSTSSQLPVHQQNSIIKENSGQSHIGDNVMTTPARPASLRCE